MRAAGRVARLALAPVPVARVPVVRVPVVRRGVGRRWLREREQGGWGYEDWRRRGRRSVSRS